MQLRDFLNFFDFDYKVIAGTIIKLIDTTGTNLGNIENEVFLSAIDVADRLDVYYHDYIYNHLSETDIRFGDVVYNGDEDYPDILEWLNKYYPDDNYFTPIVECIVNPSLLEVPELKPAHEKLADDLLKTINKNWKEVQNAIDLVIIAEAQEKLIKHSAYTDMAFRLFNKCVFWDDATKMWTY